MNLNTLVSRSLRAALMAAVLGLPVATASAQPATGPGELQRARPGALGGGGGGARGWFNREEHARALEFAQHHMPNLYHEIEEAEPGSRRQRRMAFFAVERYRWAQRIERDEPDQYEDLLERLRSHDEVFALIREFQSATEDRRSELRRQIRDKVHIMTVDLILERERRIENLKRMLGREEHQLERDRQNADMITSQRVERLLDEMGAIASPSPNMTQVNPSTAPATAPSPGDR